MQDDSKRTFATNAVRVAALWIAVGALFKLFAGTPNDLPPVVQNFSLPGWAPGSGTILHLAISIELVFVFTALLRPRWGWVWIAAQYVVFLTVLLITGMEVRETAIDPLSLGAALFDPDASCGCFGSTISVPPGYMMIADGALLVILFASRPWKGRLGQWGADWMPTGFSVIALMLPWAVIPTGGAKPPVKTEQPADGDPETPREGPQEDPDWWRGHALSDLRFIEIDIAEWNGQYIYDVLFKPFPADPDSGWAPFWAMLGLEEQVALLPIDATCMIYRDSCEHCAAHVQEMAATDDGVSQIVFIRLPEDDDAQDLVHLDEMFPVGDGRIHRLNLPDGPPYVFTTPGDFKLEGGVISEAREGIGL